MKILWFIPAAAVVGIFMSDPMVNFVAFFGSLGMTYFFALFLGMLAFALPVVLVIEAVCIGLMRLRWRPVLVTAVVWSCVTVIFVGASYGRSRWGEADRWYHSQNKPFADVLLEPLNIRELFAAKQNGRVQ